MACPVLFTPDANRRGQPPETADPVTSDPGTAEHQLGILPGDKVIHLRKRMQPDQDRKGKY